MHFNLERGNRSHSHASTSLRSVEFTGTLWNYILIFLTETSVFSPSAARQTEGTIHPIPIGLTLILSSYLRLGFQVLSLL